MIDYNTYYDLKYKTIREGLVKRFDKEVAQTKGAILKRKRNFLDKAGLERDNIISGYIPNPQGSGGNRTDNYFKKRIVDEFKALKLNFPKEKVDGFVKYTIPEERKVHKTRYENGDQGSYKHDPRFMYEATTENILDMIAMYFAYEDFFHGDYPKLSNEFDKSNHPVVDSNMIAEKENDGVIKITSPKVPLRRANDGYTILTLKQTAILFQLLKDMNAVLNDKLQPVNQMAKAIQALTGFSNNTIRDNLGTSIKAMNLFEDDFKEVEKTLDEMLKLLRSTPRI